MDQEKFIRVCDNVLGAIREKNGIGTLSEKSLHAVLKDYFAEDKAWQEIRVGNYVADICDDGGGIIEIQTRAFDRLRKKLDVFLENHVVTVVYPIAGTKWLLWLDTETGEISKRRKSPKRGNIHEAFAELYKIKHLLLHPNLRIHLLMLEIEEYRNLNGYSQDRKKGSSRFDRIPLRIEAETILTCPADYGVFVPEGMENFTSKEFAKRSHITVRRAQIALNVLTHMEAVERVGKKGNSILYAKKQ